MPAIRNKAGIGAAVLFVAILALGYTSRNLTFEAFEEESVDVECASVFTVGWPGEPNRLSDEDSFSYSSRVQENEVLSLEAREGIERGCAEARDTMLGFMIVLAVPAAILGAVAAPRRPA